MSIKGLNWDHFCTLDLLNHFSCYCLIAWHVLVFMPDLEHKSSAAITCDVQDQLKKDK